MREVTSFVVVFPARLALTSLAEKRAVLDAIRRGYPHYTFQAMDGRALEDDDEFGVIPVVGTAGSEPNKGEGVFMCKPLDPRVIPDLTQALRQIEISGVTLN